MKSEEEIRKGLAICEKSYEDAIMGNRHNDGGLGQTATTWQKGNIDATRWILEIPEYEFPKHVQDEIEQRNAEFELQMDERFMANNNGRTFEEVMNDKQPIIVVNKDEE